MTGAEIGHASGTPDPQELLLPFRAKEANFHQLMARPNVIGLDVGHRVRAGEPTDEPAVIVYVSHKVAPNLLDESARVPVTVRIDEHNVPVDVVESVVPRPTVFTLRARPLRGGMSV
jgi:hypothetical protein